MKATKNKKRGRKWKITMIILLLMLVIIASGTAMYAYRNMNYDASTPELIKKAGFVEKQVTLPDGSVINYGEGPEGGVPLLLIHGQQVSWEDYAKVLKGLSEHYHIYAVDCYGHGKSSKNPVKYTAEANGNDLIWFIEHVIGEPVVVSGHSSGGIIATWMAANSPQQVKGLVIEDAPFFATEQGRRENTFSWRDGFKTIHEFLDQTQEHNYTKFYLERSYWKTFFQGAWESLVVKPALEYMQNNPGRPPRLWYLPPAMNTVLKLTGNTHDATGDYDLRFGNAFYDGSWFEGFAQAEMLKQVHCPSLLLHTAAPESAPSYYDKNGVLLSAMDGNDARRVHALIPGNELIDNIKSGHDIHDEKPDFFVAVMVNFLKKID